MLCGLAACIWLLPQTTASAGELQWGKPARATSTNTRLSATHDAAPSSGNPLRSGSWQQDASVNAAAWETDENPTAASRDPFKADSQQDAFDQDSEYADLTPTPSEGADNAWNEPDEKSLPTIDPFEEDDRVAQLVHDPFDEPTDEPIPPLDEDLEDVSEAIRREQELRNEQRKRDAAEEEQLSLPDYDRMLEDEGFEDRDQSAQEGRGGTSGIDIEGLMPEPQAETIRPYSRSDAFRAQELEQDQKNCDTELRAVKADHISSVDLSIQLEGTAGEDYPFSCSLGNERLQPRSWPTITYNWKASALCHKPLYFEQDQLERHGHDWGPALQPILSGVHFFTSAAILPYKMGIETPNECIYALGHYRPNSCAPYIVEATPFTWRAAFYQAGVITGMSFVIP